MVRRQLGRRLKQLREAAGKSIDDVVNAGVGSSTTVWRIESGKTAAKMPVVRSMCWLYGTDPTLTESLVSMAASAAGEGWWEEYGDLVVPDWFGLYVGLEAAASRIRAFQPEVIHGLLQTPDYAEAVGRADARLGDDVVRRRVELRMQRQATVLSGQAHLTVVMSAGALELVVGSESVLAQQKAHLLTLATEQPNVSILVRPWRAGAYMMRGAYTLLDFADPDDPAVAYVEMPMGSRYIEKPAQIQEYEHVFDTVSHSSISIEDYL